VLATLTALLAAVPTPSPSPTSNVPEDAVTPGVWGFVAIAAVGVAVILLVLDMIRRLRRVNYRAQIREQIAAEQAEAAAKDGDAPASASDAAVKPTPSD
jgi:hypothetical protein